MPWRPDRVSALDAANLRVEDRGLPMNVAALLLLEEAPLLGDDGRVRLDVIRGLVAHRLGAVPRLRQVLRPPRGRRGRPVWVDAPQLDVEQHVRSLPIPEPGDEAALLEECARLNSTVLPRSRPLWELWVLTGLAGGRLAVLVRLHHVVADGAAALALVGALFDDPPTAPPAGTGGRAGPAGLVGTVRRFLAPVLAVTDVVRLGRAPRLSINRRVSGNVRLALARADLERARSVAHAHGGTVNDVVLTVVGGGVRALLEARGELARAGVLHVSLPASIRRPGEPLTGNRVGVRVVPVGLTEPEAAVRLAQVVRVTRRGKRRPPLQPAGALVQRWTVAVMDRQRLVNVLVSNLPGPASPLSLGGARVLELFQLGVVQGNVALTVGVLSYAGTLGIEVVADRDVVPDLSTFAAALERDLADLGCPPVEPSVTGTFGSGS